MRDSAKEGAAIMSIAATQSAFTAAKLSDVENGRNERLDGQSRRL